MEDADGGGLLPFRRPVEPYRLPHVEVVPDEGVPRRVIVVGHYCDRGGDRVSIEGCPHWEASQAYLTRKAAEGHFEIVAFIEPVLGEGPDPNSRPPRRSPGWRPSTPAGPSCWWPTDGPKPR